MEELYALVVKKTGLPKETAKMAVDVVVDFIKKKLPAPLAAQVDAVLGGNWRYGRRGGYARRLVRWQEVENCSC